MGLDQPVLLHHQERRRASVICDERDVPPGQEARTGIAALRLANPLS